MDYIDPSINTVLKSLLDNLFLPFSVFSEGGGLVYSNSAFDRLFENPSQVFNSFCQAKSDSSPLLKRVLVCPGPQGRSRSVLVKCFPVSQPDFSGYVIYTEDTVPVPGGRGAEKAGASPVVGRLSKKEARILHYIYKGLSSKEISESLSISINTVKTHIKKIYRKFGVQSRLQLIRKLYDEKIFD